MQSKMLLAGDSAAVAPATPNLGAKSCAERSAERSEESARLCVHIFNGAGSREEGAGSRKQEAGSREQGAGGR